MHDLLRRAVAEKRARAAELERELERERTAVRSFRDFYIIERQN